MGGLNISPRDVQGFVSDETVVALRCGDEKRNFGLKQVDKCQTFILTNEADRVWSPITSRLTRAKS